jgi:hypothetical protein
MSFVIGGLPSEADRGQVENDRLTRSIVTRAATESEIFLCPSWRLVLNAPGRPIFAVAPGLYPDLVALDGSDAGVAWILEVAGPVAITDGRAWERWSQIAASGYPLILAVPQGSGTLAEKAAGTLGIDVGLLYQYGLTSEGVLFTPVQQDSSRGRRPA